MSEDQTNAGPETAQSDMDATYLPKSSPQADAAPVESDERYDNDSDLLCAIACQTGDRVTKEYMENRIAKVAYAKIDDTVTVCSLTLDNGFSVRGESACVDPANYDERIGKTLAYKDAFDKLWPLFGFLLAEHRFLRSA